jgi:hypothetical protein
MTHQEFIVGIDLLRDTYGDRTYPDVRVERIWAWAKRLKVSTYRQIIDSAIADCDRPPLLPKLKEIYSEIRAKNPGVDKVQCDFCDGNGWILQGGIDTKTNTYTTPVAFACRCEAGQAIPEDHPRWNGPWTRIVPRPNELMRTNAKNLIQGAFGASEGAPKP